MKMNSEKVATAPSVLWAQTKTQVLLTFNVECEKPDVDIKTTSLCFKGESTLDQKLYEVDIPLFAEIDPENSSFNNKGRYIEVILVKENKENTFWPRLTSEPTKHHWLRVDFNRWQDDDDKYESDNMISSDFDSCEEEDVSESQ